MFTRLLTCRRGTVAMMAGITLTATIGIAGAGTEMGVLWATRRHAQNAADSAAYAAALALASGGNVSAIQTGGKQSAAQNAFCNSGDPTYAGSRCGTLARSTTQSVTITRGNYSGGTFTANAGGAYVQAVAAQTQPPLLSSLFLTGNVTVSAQAIAQVQALSNPCLLALTGAIGFQGSPNINVSGCGIASNDTANNALNFTGGGMTINLGTGSLSAAGGCTGAASFCNTALTYMPPVTDPLAGLETAIAGLTLPNCSSSTPVAYTAATKCTNNNLTLTGNSSITLNGIYFISGTLTLKGNSSLTSGASGATFILLPGASFSMKGTGTISITAPTTAPTAAQLPSAFSSVLSLFKDLAIFDADSSAVTLGGNSNLNFTGNLYFPQAAVTFQGNPVIASQNCGELIAASIQFNGNATFNDSGCPTGTAATQQVVQLVQ